MRLYIIIKRLKMVVIGNNYKSKPNSTSKPAYDHRKVSTRTLSFSCSNFQFFRFLVANLGKGGGLWQTKPQKS